MTDLASLARRAAEQKAIADHACAQAGSHGEEDHVARANAGTVLMLCHLPAFASFVSRQATANSRWSIEVMGHRPKLKGSVAPE